MTDMLRRVGVRRRSFYARVFVVVFASSACLVLLLESVLFVGLSRGHAENARQLQESLILQSQRSTETLLKQAERLLVSLALREDLTRYSARGFRNIDYDRFRTTTGLLRILVTGAIGDFVHSLYLYDFGSGKIMSDDGVMDLRYSPDASFALDAVRTQLVREWLVSRPWGPNGEPVTTYVMPIPLSGTGSSYLILNLNESFFSSNYDDLFGEFDTHVAIRDRQANLSVDVGVPVAWLDEADRTGGGKLTLRDGADARPRTYYATVTTSPYTGWRYYTFTPAEAISAPSGHVVTFAIGAILVFLLLALALSFALARFIYAPIRRLGDEIAKMRPGSTAATPDDASVELNELAAIERRFHQLYDLNQEYQDEVERNRVLLRERRHWDLVSGRPVSDEVLANLHAGDGDRGSSEHAIVFLEYDPEIVEAEHIKLDAYREANRWLHNNSGREVRVLFTLLDQTRVVVALRVADEAKKSAFLARVSGELMYLSRYQFGVVAGVSVAGIRDVHVSFRDAETLARHRRFFSGSIIASSDRPDDTERQTAFLEVERRVAELRGALERGEVSRARAIIGSILFESGGTSDYVYRESKAVQLANVLLGYVVIEGVDDALVTEDSDPWRAFSRIKTLEEMRTWFDGWLARIEAYLDRRQVRSQYRYVADCREYLALNYRKPITIRNAAEAVGINAAYLSTIFHHETGKTFSVYLTELRMRKARELLESTRGTLEEVASKSGFIAKQNLIRTFKRTLGCTPGAYRSRHVRAGG